MRNRATDAHDGEWRTPRAAAATTLAHAAFARRRAHRLRRSLLWLCAALALGYGSWRCVQRFYQINRDPYIGPIDIALILREPALWGPAWTLLWNPERAHIPDWSELANKTVVFAPLRPYIGSEPDDVQISAATPLRYHASRLQLDIVIGNTCSRTVAVPAVRRPPWTGLTAIAGQDAGWLHEVAPESAGWLSLGVVTWNGCLARGTRLLRPGEVITITLVGPAPPRPCTVLIVVPLFGSWHELLIDIPCDEAGHPRWQRWSEVPAEAIRSRRFRHEPE